jgi:hypothetical protein
MAPTEEAYYADCWGLYDDQLSLRNLKINNINSCVWLVKFHKVEQNEL